MHYRIRIVASLLLQLFFSVLVLAVQDDFTYTADRIDGLPFRPKCETISIQFCQGMEYNQTMMPNLYGNQNQNEVATLIHVYYPALSVKCSPDIQSFLCSYYAPVCTDPGPLPPCRSLCSNVKKGCEKLLKTFSLPWPPHLECDNFPDDSSNDKVLCVRKNQTSNIIPSNKSHNLDIAFNPDLRNFDSGSGKNFKQPKDWFYENSVNHDYPYICPVNLNMSRGFSDSFRVNNTVINNCALPCDNMFFDDHEREFSHFWIGTWSMICVISCLFTVLTFAINTSRFRYPERPIIFLAFCYLVIAFIYVLGSISNNKIVCRRVPGKLVSTIVQGTKNELCTIMFIGLYFFSMASSLWWVILALTWFLAAGLKWGHEAIEANSQYFHLVAWALPTIKTITILAMGKIEGDDLTGICNVGVWNMETMRTFVLAPLSVYLLIGILFLIFGFVSLFRIRKVMKHDGTKTDKLEKLMLRIGIFSVLYTLPAFTVIICLIYEQVNFDSWMVTWYGRFCRSDAVTRCPLSGTEKKPIFFIFMLKYLSSLIVGITSSVWVWSNKTLSTWKKLILNIKGKRGQTFV